MSQELRRRLPPGMTLERGPEESYEAYNEQAFRHFLGVERRRAERAGRTLLLMLVDLERGPSGDVFPEGVASRVFAAMTSCVREVDFIGWYRASRVAGAVLAQGADGPGPEVSEQIAGRMAAVLAGRVPAQVAQRIQVRVLQLRSSDSN